LVVDAAKDGRVVLVLAADAAMQDSVRRIVDEAGCRPIIASTPEKAKRHLDTAPTQPVLILVDPACPSEVLAQLGPQCPIVEIPVRTSATGVRRVAKRGAAATRWLMDLIADRCSSQR